MLRTLSRLQVANLTTVTAPRILSCSCMSTSTRSAAPSSFTTRPGPPPLDRASQREFEELQRRVNAPASKPAPGTTGAETTAVITDESKVDEQTLTMHPDLRKPPPPLFEGETNPTTGEIGGPKREPLVHGEQSSGVVGPGGGTFVIDSRFLHCSRTCR